MNKYPTLKLVYQNLKDIPEFVAALPENQADAEWDISDVLIKIYKKIKITSIIIGIILIIVYYLYLLILWVRLSHNYKRN